MHIRVKLKQTYKNCHFLCIVDTIGNQSLFLMRLPFWKSIERPGTEVKLPDLTAIVLPTPIINDSSNQNETFIKASATKDELILKMVTPRCRTLLQGKHEMPIIGLDDVLDRHEGPLLLERHQVMSHPPALLSMKLNIASPHG